MASAPRRDRINATDRTEFTAKSDNISAPVATSDRRNGALCSPVVPENSDSQNPTTTSPWPEVSWSTLTAGEPMSREKLSAGAEEVAEAPIKTRSVFPRCAQIRRNRVSTTATCEPNTPRYVWDSSTITYLRFRKNCAHPPWLGKMPTCNMSGFVTRTLACSRAHARAWGWVWRSEGPGRNDVAP